MVRQQSNPLRSDYKEMRSNYTTIAQRSRRGRAVIAQRLCSGFEMITQQFRNDRATISK
jgi:hypothetical protein